MPQTDETLHSDLMRLADEVALLNQHRFVTLHNSPVRLIGFHFLRGLAFGLGTAIGATALVSVVAVLLSQIEFIPIIGDLARAVIAEIEVQ